MIVERYGRLPANIFRNTADLAVTRFLESERSHCGVAGRCEPSKIVRLREQNELIYVAIGNGDITLKIATRLEIGERSTIFGEPLSRTALVSEVPHGTQHHAVIVKTDNR